MDEWQYAVGLGMIMISYSDILRFRGASTAFNVLLQLLFGLSYLVFQIWGFFVFDWWVPIFYVIGAGIAIGIVQGVILGGPGLLSIPLGLIGIILCAASLQII